MNLVLGGTGLKMRTNSSGGEIRKLFYKHRSPLTLRLVWLFGLHVFKVSRLQPTALAAALELTVKSAPTPHGFTVAYWRASKRRL